MTAIDENFTVNLEDIYDRVTTPLLWYLLILGGIGSWWFIPLDSSRLRYFIFFLAMSLVSFIGLRYRVNTIFTRYWLTASITMLFLAALWFYPLSWLPFFSVPVILVSRNLIPGSEWITFGLILGEVIGLTFVQKRELNIYIILGTMVFAVIISRATAQALFTGLDWLIAYGNRIKELLEETRQHRGELARMVKSLEIVTNIQKRMESELIIAKKQAEEAGLAKQQFAANVSHELRTPLSIIFGFSEIMYLNSEVYGKMEWPPALRRDIYQIYASSQYLQKMIDDILVLSKFDLAEFIMNLEPTPISQFLQESTEIIILRDVVIHECGQRLAGEAFDDDAFNVHGDAVVPCCARLMREWQLGKSVDEILRSFYAEYFGVQIHLIHSCVGQESVSEACRVGHQIDHCGSMVRIGEDHFSSYIEAVKYFEMLELRDELRDRV